MVMKELSIVLLTFFLTIVNFAANAQITFKVNETCATPKRDIDVRTNEYTSILTIQDIPFNAIAYFHNTS